MSAVCVLSEIQNLSTSMSSLPHSECDYCATEPSTIRCLQCGSAGFYCIACDAAVHRHKNRKHHIRNALTLVAAPSSEEVPMVTDSNDIAANDANTKKRRVDVDSAEQPLSRAMNHVQISKIELAPMGVFESCWVEKYGAPRQGALVNESRGIIHLSCFKGARHSALEGLEDFSHLVVLFLFHDNRDRRTELRPDPECADGQIIRYTSEPAAKVQPPRLSMSNKHKLGVFATRTPHRPAPIGLTICKIEKVLHSQGRVVVSGIDIIDKTPIIDIKPYVPRYDSFPDARTPTWITPDVVTDPTASATATVSVTLSAEAEADLVRLSPKLKLFPHAPDAARACIVATLSEDIRSRHEKRRGPGVYGFCLDVLNIVFEVSIDAQEHVSCHVQRIEHWPQNFAHVRSQPHH